MIPATVETAAGALRVDLSRPIDVSIPMRFDGPQPEFFGAPPATARALEVGGWVGDVRRGSGCNVLVHRLTPHCNGTHTECVGHVTDEPVHVAEVHRGGLVAAALVTVEPVDATRTDETSDPGPGAGARLITAAGLRAALDAVPEARGATALAIRRPAGAGDRSAARYRFDAPPPYLSLEAVRLVVELGARHLLVDVPSLDAMTDGGKLSAHHVWFGLPPGSHDRAAATRADATITEMILVPDGIADGLYLLDLQIPPFLADAAPSRPLLYEVLRDDRP